MRGYLVPAPCLPLVAPDRCPDVRGRNRERYVNYFTLARNNPLACLRFRKKTQPPPDQRKSLRDPAPRQQPLTPPTSPAVRRRRSMLRPRDAFRRENVSPLSPGSLHDRDRILARASSPMACPF